MKAILLLITVIFSLNSFSQSKKEQIQILTEQRDSVIGVLNFEKSVAFKNIAVKDSIIFIEIKQVEKLKDTISTLISKLSLSNLELISKKNQIESMQSKLSTSNLELDNKKNQIESMRTEILNKSDSLKLLKGINEIDNTDAEFELKYSTLNKPATPSMKEIGDWLSQFTLNCDNSIRFIDKEIANFYGGDEPILELHGKVAIQNLVYKEGILFSQRLEYEGVIYQLFIPLLNLTDVKKNIDKLCKNMGGCIQPEEMEIKYEETEFGIKITWGGGC